MARILVVDDDGPLRETIAEIIAQAGHDVEQACDGVAALEMLQAGPLPDIIVTDGNMPRMNGIELARRARKLGSRKILLLTGVENDEFQNEARTAGVDRIVEKPFDFRALLRVIAELLQ